MCPSADNIHAFRLCRYHRLVCHIVGLRQYHKQGKGQQCINISCTKAPTASMAQ